MFIFYSTIVLYKYYRCDLCRNSSGAKLGLVVQVDSIYSDVSASVAMAT